MKNKNIEELLRLIKENPDLPIVPMVNSGVVVDGWGYWPGTWGSAYIDEYIIIEKYDTPILFKSDNDVFDVLEKCMSDKEFGRFPDTENECRPWTKAIIVYIDLP